MKKTLLLTLLLLGCFWAANAQTVEFSDDFESGTGNWVLTGAWGLATSQSHSPSNSLADSPAGNYAANQNITATMANGIDLSSALDATLTFWAIYDIEGGNFDYCYVEASNDGGATFINIATFLGEDQLTPWTQYSYSLGGMVGSDDVKVRFRFFSDGGYEVDGIFIDDVEITSSNEDNSAPLILHEPPQFYHSVLGDQVVFANLVDVSGIGDATLTYSVNGGSTMNTAGTLLIDDFYFFIIPDQAAGSQVDYYLTATDGSANLNVGSTPTYSYIAGNHILYDDEEVDFVNSFGPVAASALQGAAVRFTLGGTTDIKYALIRNYTDVNRPNSDFLFHIWANNNGLPGADLITPFMVTPEATLIDNSPMTRVDLSAYSAQLSDLSGDVFVGFTVPAGETWVVQTTPATGGRSYVSNGTTWAANANDDYHFRIVTTQFDTPDDCADAFDLTDLQGGGTNNPQVSTVFDNTDATAGGEPTVGYECFDEGSLENTVWYTFVGDGGAYEIRTLNCNLSATYNNDTQIAVYEGTDCGALTPVACNEDTDFPNSIYEAKVTLQTEVGVTYFMMIDGWDGTVGEFCIEFNEVNLVTCADIAAGATDGDHDVCLGETTSFTLGAGTVIPQINPFFGMLWAIHTEDVSGSSDPFNEASWLGNFGAVSDPANIYTPQLVNDGTQVPFGTYYFTPIVFGGAVDVDGTWPNLDFSNGCVLTGSSVEVNLWDQVDALSVSTSSVGEIAGTNNGEATATVTGGTGDYTYAWSNGGTTSTITGLNAGTYTVTVSDISTCAEEVVETVVVEELPNSTIDPIFQQAIAIQPNPASSTVQISYHFEKNVDLKITVTNTMGMTVNNLKIAQSNNNSMAMDVAHFSKGVYFVHFTDGERHAVKRLVVN